VRSRYALVLALLKSNTRLAVQSALDHILAMLHLCREDVQGVRKRAPALFLRLGKDQECYDFLKWWATTGQETDYDWQKIDLGYLDVKDADAFEDVTLYTGEYYSLSHSVSLTLIKFRILQDLKNLQGSTLVGQAAPLPQEILDNIRANLVGNIVAGKREIMDSNYLGPIIKKMESQVRRMYKAVDMRNEHFWHALIHPGDNLTAPPPQYIMGPWEEMQMVLQYSYASWCETPGAIDWIHGLRKSDQ
jgi:hypothetical protein